jgi:hypothetical protein
MLLPESKPGARCTRHPNRPEPTTRGRSTLVKERTIIGGMQEISFLLTLTCRCLALCVRQFRIHWIYRQTRFTRTHRIPVPKIHTLWILTEIVKPLSERTCTHFGIPNCKISGILNTLEKATRMVAGPVNVHLARCAGRRQARPDFRKLLECSSIHHCAPNQGPDQRGRKFLHFCNSSFCPLSIIIFCS